MHSLFSFALVRRIKTVNKTENDERREEAAYLKPDESGKVALVQVGALLLVILK